MMQIERFEDKTDDELRALVKMNMAEADSHWQTRNQYRLSGING